MSEAESNQDMGIEALPRLVEELSITPRQIAAVEKIAVPGHASARHAASVLTTDLLIQSFAAYPRLSRNGCLRLAGRGAAMHRLQLLSGQCGAFRFDSKIQSHFAQLLVLLDKCVKPTSTLTSFFNGQTCADFRNDRHGQDLVSRRLVAWRIRSGTRPIAACSADEESSRRTH